VRFKLYFKTKGHLVVVHPLLLSTSWLQGVGLAVQDKALAAVLVDLEPPLDLQFLLVRQLL
jgi:hypothetical protein